MEQTQQPGKEVRKDDARAVTESEGLDYEGVGHWDETEARPPGEPPARQGDEAPQERDEEPPRPSRE